MKTKSDIRPSMVTHTRNLCSAFNPSKVHTHSSEHTQCGQPFILRRPGSSWGFGALLKGTSVVERALDISYNSCRCCAEICTLPDYAPPSIGRFWSRCGGGVRIRGGVGIRQSGSDFNEGMHNLAGVQISAQHRPETRTHNLSITSLTL